MDAAQALADLTEISSQVETATIFAPDGSVLGSTLDDDERSRELVRLARELLDAAGSKRPAGGASLNQLEVALHDGSVFVVREAERGIVAVTAPEPTVGLVFYDLKSALHSLDRSDDGA